MRRKSAPDPKVIILQHHIQTSKTFENLQISPQTGIAQDYLNKFLMPLFLEPLVRPNNSPDRLASLLLVVRNHVRLFPTYRQYLRSELISAGYSGKKLSQQIDSLMSQKNAIELEALSKKVRANFDGPNIDIFAYLADYKQALILIYGRLPADFKVDREFASALDKIINHK